MSTSKALQGPLKGIRVVEVGQLIAGPWAGAILGHFGAEVIKVEPPQGDPIRTWRHLDDDGTSHWWRSIARNKRSVVCDLSSEGGRSAFKRIASASDVLIENFSYHGGDDVIAIKVSTAALGWPSLSAEYRPSLCCH